MTTDNNDIFNNDAATATDSNDEIVEEENKKRIFQQSRYSYEYRDMDREIFRLRVEFFIQKDLQ